MPLTTEAVSASAVTVGGWSSSASVTTPGGARVRAGWSTRRMAYRSSRSSSSTRPENRGSGANNSTVVTPSAAASLRSVGSDAESRSARSSLRMTETDTSACSASCSWVRPRRRRMRARLSPSAGVSVDTRGSGSSRRAGRRCYPAARCDLDGTGCRPPPGATESTDGLPVLSERGCPPHDVRTVMVTAAPENMRGTAMQRLAAQGYTQPIIAVEVRNVGRMAVTVQRWSIKHTRGVSFAPFGAQIGPELPYRLEPGAAETWAVAAEPVLSLRDTAMETLPQKEVYGRPEG